MPSPFTFTIGAQALRLGNGAREMFTLLKDFQPEHQAALIYRQSQASSSTAIPRSQTAAA